MLSRAYSVLHVALRLSVQETKQKKTIFLAINRGILARNILRSGVLERLLDAKNLKIVILVNRKIHDYFRKEFAHPNIILEEVPEKKNNRFRQLTIILFNGLVYRETERRKLKFGGGNKPPQTRWKFLLKHSLFSVLSRITVLKYIVRWVESRIFIERDYDYLFLKYHPDLVFCASIYARGLDFVLIKAARRFGVPSVSMPKSWDTVGRLFFSAPSDIFILNNEFMKENLVTEQLIPRERIYVSGFPQFDVYANPKERMTKEQLCANVGLDPQKPLVLYASEGAWTHWDDMYLDELIEKHGILKNCNLILRPHFSDFHLNRYHRFRKYDGIYIDDKHFHMSGMFGDKWDPSKEDMKWLAGVLSASDIIITFVSTFALDAMAFNKPVINIYYDAVATRKTGVPMIPMKELYNCVHYNVILDEHSVVLARTAAEVIGWIKKYTENPNLHEAERKKTIDKLCYKVDGNASERIADVLLKTLNLKS